MLTFVLALVVVYVIFNSVWTCLTFLSHLVLAVFISARPPGAPGRHFALNRTADMAELRGVR